MRRGPYGRDLGLTVRMAVALLPIAVWYLGATLLLLAFVVATAADGDWGAFLGALLFAVGIPAMLVAHVKRGERLALRTTRARVLDPGDEPELQALVARVAAQADLPPPRVALVRSWSANAFSVGRTPERAVVAVTTGLLRRLTPGELEAVAAHEVASQTETGS